jgi:tetratricopeptide (TPR) repeat protein
MGVLHLRKGDLQRAIPVLERGLALCRVANIPGLYPRVASQLGYAYALFGRVAEALPLLEQATSVSTMADHSLWVSWLSEAYMLAGRLEDAIALAGRALDLCREHEERGHQAWSHRLLGEIHSHQDPSDVENAESHYRQALTLAEELGMRPLLAHCHLGLGTLYAQMGQVEKASAELSTAVGLYRSMAMTFWLPQGEATLAEVEGR